MDFDYNEQQVLQNLHILPDEFEEQDYYRLAEVMSAQSMDERPLSGHQFLKQAGVQAGNI